MNHYFRICRLNGNIHHVCLSEIDDDTLLAYLDVVKGQHAPIKEMEYKAQMGFSNEIFSMPLGNGYVTSYVQSKPPEKRDWSPWILLVAGLALLAAAIIPFL